jgi:hypothetical protein
VEHTDNYSHAVLDGRRESPYRLALLQQYFHDQVDTQAAAAARTSIEFPLNRQENCGCPDISA